MMNVFIIELKQFVFYNLRTLVLMCVGLILKVKMITQEPLYPKLLEELNLVEPFLA
jgi:hypothetical protein